jgi:hypothetical protein
MQNYFVGDPNAKNQGAPASLPIAEIEELPYFH